MHNATATTKAQHDRNEHRDPRTGKFIKNPCDACGKGCPMEYFSSAFCNEHGQGLVLHERCAAKVDEHLTTLEEHEAFFDLVKAIRTW